MGRTVKKKRKRKALAAKQQKKSMLRGSEWVLLGILFVGISEFIVKCYSMSWRFMPYTIAVCIVLMGRFLLVAIKAVTKTANYFLDSIKYI